MMGKMIILKKYVKENDVAEKSEYDGENNKARENGNARKRNNYNENDYTELRSYCISEGNCDFVKIL